MKVYGLWWGGSSYAVPDMSSLEVFDSIEHAETALGERFATGGFFPQTFHFANGIKDSVLCPTVDENTQITLYLSLPNSDDPYPDKIITLSGTEPA